MTIASGLLLHPGPSASSTPIVGIQLRKRRQLYLLARQAQFFFPQKDVRDLIWMIIDAEWLHYRRKQKAMYAASRENGLSFPTPKLGAKTRPC